VKRQSASHVANHAGGGSVATISKRLAAIGAYAIFEVGLPNFSIECIRDILKL